MKHIVLTLLLSGFAMVNFSTVSIADNSINKQQLLEQPSAEKLINIIRETETLDRQIAYELAPVKSKADLDRLSSQHSPLDALSPDAKSRFLENITFGNKGITGLYYGDLENELSFTQLYKILALFGAQHLIAKFGNARIETVADTLLKTKSLGAKNTPGLKGQPGEDYKGYACISPHTCAKRTFHICMSGC